MIKKLLQMKNARLILGFALLIIVLSALFGLRSFETSKGLATIVCTSAWRPMEFSFVVDYSTPDDLSSISTVLVKTTWCDVLASSRRYTIYFVAATTFSILAGGLLVSERLRKKV